jgi:hypothetical protein
MRDSELISLRIVHKKTSYKPHLVAFTVPGHLEAESFPLVRYTAAMHPPRVSDAEVRAVIRELTVDKTLPAGAAVRRSLESRFGSRGGVARIYRLLAEELVRFTSPPSPSSAEMLERDLQAMTERAQRAEAREEAHQTHWAAEIDRLRMKVQTLEPLAQRGRMALEGGDLLRHQLHAAEQRAARLEEQLRPYLEPPGSVD